MTFNQLLEAYFKLIWDMFMYDMEVLSTPWVIFTVIPAIIYIAFFFIKWYILLMPITLPLTMIGKLVDTFIKIKLLK